MGQVEFRPDTNLQSLSPVAPHPQSTRRRSEPINLERKMERSCDLFPSHVQTIAFGKMCYYTSRGLVTSLLSIVVNIHACKPEERLPSSRDTCSNTEECDRSRQMNILQSPRYSPCQHFASSCLRKILYSLRHEPQHVYRGTSVQRHRHHTTFGLHSSAWLEICCFVIKVVVVVA